MNAPYLATEAQSHTVFIAQDGIQIRDAIWQGDPAKESPKDAKLAISTATPQQKTQNEEIMTKWSSST